MTEHAGFVEGMRLVIVEVVSAGGTGSASMRVTKASTDATLTCASERHCR